MAIKMVTGSMVSRSFRSATFGVVLAAAAVLTIACQKVPLLAPSGSTITLTAAASALPLNGTTQIIAQLIEAAGTPPHEGTRVTFTTSLGRFEPAEADTDVGGRAITTFVAGTSSGVASITALSGGTSVTAANAVKIQIGAAAVGQIGANASPATLPATGGTSLITATVSDVSGNALPGVPVTFAIDTTTGSSGAGTLSATGATTDANGRATTQLTTNRTTTVSASAGVAAAGGGTGGTGGTTVQTSKVTVNVNTTASITVGAPSPATPTVNQTVTLPLTYATSTTASPVTSVRVDWGDGVIATITGQPAAVSHSYGRAGSFLVVVSGTDAIGDTTSTTTSITVNPRPQPTVAITATPSNPQPSQAVSFTAAVTQGTTGATTQSVTWSFSDDGSSFTLQGNSLSIVHIFNQAGLFLVTATVTDSTGATGTSQLPIVVGNGGVTTAAFTVSPTGGPVATVFQFNASDSSAASGIASYAWDFGDGNTATGVTTTHKYATAQTFTVRLTVTDNNGRTNSTTKQVVVTAT
jgi:PKD repeat protein